MYLVFTIQNTSKSLPHSHLDLLPLFFYISITKISQECKFTVHICSSSGRICSISSLAAMPAIKNSLNYSQQLEVAEIRRALKEAGSLGDLIPTLRQHGFSTICPQTARRYVREEAKTRQLLEQNSLKATRSRQSPLTLPDLEDELANWVHDSESRNLRLTGQIIKEKAAQIARKHGVVGVLSFSDGWLTRFERRWGLKE